MSKEKRTASELSSSEADASEKRGRPEVESYSPAEEQPRVFPSSSPNQCSFLNIALQSTPFNLLNSYGFTDKNNRSELLKELQPHMLGRLPSVVGGDFNCILSRQDRKGTGEDFKVDKTSLLLQGLCRDFKLTDCFKSMHPREEGFTWFSGDSTSASRIDCVFTRDCPAADARLAPVFFSDHSMLSCTLSPSTGVTAGRGLWKLNCSLLEDRELVSQYREQYKEWQTLQDFYDTRAHWWEMVEERTQTFFRQAFKRKKDRENRRMMGLQKPLQRYFKLNNRGLDFNEEMSQGVSATGVETGPKADLVAARQRAVVAQVSLQSEQAFRLLLKTSV